MVPPAPAGLGVQPKGLRKWDIAATGRAVCPLCNERIGKGLLRLSYRFVAARKIGDERYIHFSCAYRFPLGTKATDIAMLVDWCALPELVPDMRDQFMHALALVRGPAAPGPSAPG